MGNRIPLALLGVCMLAAGARAQLGQGPSGGPGQGVVEAPWATRGTEAVIPFPADWQKWPQGSETKGDLRLEASMAYRTTFEWMTLTARVVPKTPAMAARVVSVTFLHDWGTRVRFADGQPVVRADGSQENEAVARRVLRPGPVGPYELVDHQVFGLGPLRAEVVLEPWLPRATRTSTVTLEVGLPPPSNPVRAAPAGLGFAVRYGTVPGRNGSYPAELGPTGPAELLATVQEIEYELAPSFPRARRYGDPAHGHGIALDVFARDRGRRPTAGFDDLVRTVRVLWRDGAITRIVSSRAQVPPD